GQPEQVINYFFFVAEAVRRLMARLGVRHFNDLIGRRDLLDTRQAIGHWKARGLDFSRLFYHPVVDASVATHHCESQDHGLDRALDHELIRQAQPALEHRQPVRIEQRIYNYQRTVGAMLSGRVAERFGHAGLPEDCIYIKAQGTAGQSFGAWLAHGVTLELEGEANDYVGKGLSGGRLILYPPAHSGIEYAEENIIVGNTVLYGAIAGECFFRGVAGERFAVRNSGATAVVEGVGDHGCEYMTGGIVVCLGSTGRNFAAGMSGGIAYVFDESGDFDRRCNRAMVELETIREEPGEAAGTLESQTPPDLHQDMTRHDALRLRQLVESHLRYTGSEVARRLLDDWSGYLPRFVKVMPIDYRRALQDMQARQQKIAMGTGQGGR
ncbi:MAG: glutamate synthase subunit alpha, partial [Pseudomonadota bacterium]